MSEGFSIKILRLGHVVDLDSLTESWFAILDAGNGAELQDVQISEEFFNQMLATAVAAAGHGPELEQEAPSPLDEEISDPVEPPRPARPKVRVSPSIQEQLDEDGFTVDDEG